MLDQLKFTIAFREEIPDEDVDEFITLVKLARDTWVDWLNWIIDLDWQGDLINSPVS